MPSPWRSLPPFLLCALFVSSIGLGACSFFSTDEALLSDSTMTKVLVEIHLVNARQDHVGAAPPGLKDSVFARHGVERSDFEATLRHYSRNPQAFNALYNTVLDTLNSIQSELRRSRTHSSENLPGGKRSNRSSRRPN